MNIIKDAFLRLKRRVKNLAITGIPILLYQSMYVDRLSHSPFTQQLQYSTKKLASEQIQDHLFWKKTIIDGKIREYYNLIGFIKGYMQQKSNFSNPKGFIYCSKNILEYNIEIVRSRYTKYENLFEI